MIRVIYGEKGTGKTKLLVDTANKLASSSSGDIVFIDGSNHLIYDLKHEIRFINSSEFPVSGAPEFLGFICGIISQDYDIEGIFIDGLTYILKQKSDMLENFFIQLKGLSDRFKIDFFISINGNTDAIPEYIKEYTA